MAKITCYEYVYNLSDFFESNAFFFYRMIMVFILTFYFEQRKRVSSLYKIIDLFIRRIFKQGAKKLTSIQNSILNLLRRGFLCVVFYFQRGCQINKVLQISLRNMKILNLNKQHIPSALS